MVGEVGYNFPECVFIHMSFHVGYQRRGYHYVVFVTWSAVVQRYVSGATGIIVNKSNSTIVASETFTVPAVLQRQNPRSLLGRVTRVNSSSDLLASSAKPCHRAAFRRSFANFTLFGIRQTWVS